MQDVREPALPLLHSLFQRLAHSASMGGTSVPAMPLRLRLAPGSLRARLRERTVLITGASSGIGRATALKVAAMGARTLLVARSESKLHELQQEIVQAGGRAQIYAADLSTRQGPDTLLTALAAEGVSVDVLINSAGRSIRRSVGDSVGRVHDYERTMALNYFGALQLIVGLLPGMRARRSGHIINVSSAGVQVGTPFFSAYIASKAALDAFSRVAAAESRADGVHISTVHMPLVRTPMIEPTAAFRDVPALAPEEAADMVLRPLLTREPQLGTHMGKLWSLLHLLLPVAAGQLLDVGPLR